jgi:hypothetical protein
MSFEVDIGLFRSENTKSSKVLVWQSTWHSNYLQHEVRTFSDNKSTKKLPLFVLHAVNNCFASFVITNPSLLFLIHNFKYSQTWVNDHLRITTTCMQRPLFLGPNFNFHNIKLALNNDHLSTTATNFGSRGWSLYTGLTVFWNLYFKFEVNF